jgi:acyl dehydratase
MAAAPLAAYAIAFRCQVEAMRYFEDLNEGDVFELGEARMSEPEMLEFARRYDPQPFHVDADAAARSPYGGLIASGWHTASVYMGLLVRGLLHDVASLGAGGLEELRWAKPVRPGDVLTGRLTILSKRASDRNPARGTIVALGELLDAAGERVFFMRWPAMIARRPGAAGAAGR